MRISKKTIFVGGIILVLAVIMGIILILYAIFRKKPDLPPIYVAPPVPAVTKSAATSTSLSKTTATKAAPITPKKRN